MPRGERGMEMCTIACFELASDSKYNLHMTLQQGTHIPTEILYLFLTVWTSHFLIPKWQERKYYRKHP